MKRSIRDVRDNLYRKSVALRYLANENPGDVGFKLRDKQDVLYKKWEFYDKIIKASDKVK